MSTALVWGSTEQARKETALKLLAEEGIDPATGLVEVGKDKAKIGIGEIKALLPHLYIRALARVQRRGESRDSHIFTPNGKGGVMVPEAQRLTVQAQNALLKILEDPPAHLTLTLTTPHPKLLLPTIVSRCLVHHVADDLTPRARRETPRIDEVKKLFAANPGERLAIFEEEVGYAREDIFTLLDAIESYLGKEMSQKNAQKLEKLWEVKRLLRGDSANPKLIIDELLISW